MKVDRAKVKEAKQKHKIIFRRPSGQQPASFSETKIKTFLSNHKDHLKKFIFLGWVKRNYPVYEANEFIKLSDKKELRFMVSTAETRIDARRIHKRSEKFGEEIWDIT